LARTARPRPPGPIARLALAAGVVVVGRRGRLAHLAGAGILVGLLGWALWRLDLRAVGEALASARPAWLVAGMLANVLSLAAHSARWASVVVPVGRRVRHRDAFGALTAGFAAGVVLPARAGDLVRAHLLARRSGLSTASTLAAAGVDYVVGAVALLPLIGALAELSPLPSWARHAAGALGVAGAVGAVAAVALARRARPGEEAHGGGGLRGRWARLRAGLSAAREPKSLARALAFAVCGWGAEVLIAWCVLRALQLTPGPAGVEVAALAVLATTLVNVAAVSPGNAGPFELAAVLALSSAGVDREPAVAFALLYHLVHLVPVGLLGSAWMLAAAHELEVDGPGERGARS
jgi:uncharacterized membrane protein YbhN (UPF0104 family)